MNLSSRAHDLYQAFSQPGCPICRLTLDSVHHYLDSLIYEYVNKVPTHEAVRASRGFCPTHAWHIQDHVTASALGVAVLYEGVIRHMLKDMGAIDHHAGRRQLAQAAGSLRSRAPCPACTHQQTAEEHLIRNLLDHLPQTDFADAFRQSAGICLPHLRQVLDGPGRIPAKALLTAIQQDIWEELRAELAEFRRKRDYRIAPEGMGPEGTSPRRCIEQMAGTQGVR